LNTQDYLDRVVALFIQELEENLIGIYLHGSLAMECFNPNRSDIDLFIVVKEKLDTLSSKRIATMAVAFHKELPNKGGLEFTIILEKHLIEFVYPTPFEFHYSPYHTEKYETDENYLCGGFEDEDLAAQIVVAYERGSALYGRPLQEVYRPIDEQYYIASILHDIESSKQEILDNKVYFTLNLCRVLYFLREGQVASKKEAGEWGIKFLPHRYQELIEECLHEYIGVTLMSKIENHQFLEFADYMLDEIQRSRKTIRSFRK